MNILDFKTYKEKQEIKYLDEQYAPTEKEQFASEMDSMAEVMEMSTDEILIISPKFITNYEKTYSSDWYWNTTSWKWGMQSYNSPYGENVSSFEVIDSVIDVVVLVVLDIVPVVKFGTMFALAGKAYIKNSNKSFRIAHI